MRKKYEQLSCLEREDIYLLDLGGESLSAIADELGRDKSTISRELRRNRKNGVGYLPDYASKQAQQRRYRGCHKLDKHPELKALILWLMHERKWSPAAIAGRLCEEEQPVKVCAETIYRYIYSSANGIKFQLYKLLPKQKVRRWRHKSRKSHSRIKDRVSIHHRPPPEGIGHFEDDLMVFGRSGKNIHNSSDINSKLIVLTLNKTKHSFKLINNMEKKMKHMNITSKSRAYDNGTEFSMHHLLNKKGIATYFCDPYCPHQKPRVENNNALVRRFLPKNLDQELLNDNLVDYVQDIINLTPRKSLNFKTPIEAHYGLNLKLTNRCTSN